VTAAGAHRRRDSFTVDPDALTARAGEVDNLADRVHQVAGGPLLLDNGAFGMIGNMFGSVAALQTQILDRFIERAGPVVSEIAEDLRDSATAYSEAEWRTGAGFEVMCR
jgi:hypothetical protein